MTAEESLQSSQLDALMLMKAERRGGSTQRGGSIQCSEGRISQNGKMWLCLWLRTWKQPHSLVFSFSESQSRSCEPGNKTLTILIFFIENVKQTKMHKNITQININWSMSWFKMKEFSTHWILQILHWDKKLPEHVFVLRVIKKVSESGKREILLFLCVPEEVTELHSWVQVFTLVLTVSLSSWHFSVWQLLFLTLSPPLLCKGPSACVCCSATFSLCPPGWDVSSFLDEPAASPTSLRSSLCHLLSSFPAYHPSCCRRLFHCSYSYAASQHSPTDQVQIDPLTGRTTSRAIKWHLCVKGRRFG